MNLLSLAMIGAVIVVLLIIMFLFDYREYVLSKAPHEIQYGTDEFERLELQPISKFTFQGYQNSVWKGRHGYYCFDEDGTTCYGPFLDSTTASIEGHKYFN